MSIASYSVKYRYDTNYYALCTVTHMGNLHTYDAILLMVINFMNRPKCKFMEMCFMK